MANLNKHIEDYLSYYLESKFRPDFAVLLQGKWGCGKTWFIQKFIENFPQKKNCNFLYITLYGISSISEIEDQIFQQLHPVLSSKAMALTGKILKGVLRASLKIDLDAGKQSGATINAQLSDINLPEYLKNTDGRILVFDDLERCKLPVDIALGYINSFVEHQKLKVIILANEDELQEIEESEEDNNKIYKRIKEKLIGKTFRVNHDVESAYNNFTEQIENEGVRIFLDSKKDTILKIFNAADYKNLRHLKQCLWDFERFYSTIPSKYTVINDLMEELLSIFLALLFEIKGGKIIPANIDNFQSMSIAQILSTDDSKKPVLTPMEKVIEKYDFLNIYETLLTEKCWQDLFDKGYINTDIIAESLENSSYCRNDNSPDWVKLWHHFDMSDEEFISTFEKVNGQWKSNEFKEPGEVLHVCGLFLKFSHAKLIPKGISVVLSECKKYICDMKDTGQWHNYHKSNGRFVDKSQWRGLGYAGNDLEEFEKISSFLDEKLSESRIESFPAAGKELLTILSEDSEKFERMIFLSNSEDSLYYQIPILLYISPNDFLNSFLKLDNRSKMNVISALDERYKFPDLLPKLYVELEFLEETNSLVQTKAKENEGKLSGYILSRCSHYLVKIINKIKDQKITNQSA